ncbi:hypothetical protein [Dyella sp. 2RAB6]|uniref:hypothetical protein n=1 Tax=Dyella sp. 2RAB6 TaxID=3232992 RepID=UPI003F8FC10E
MTFVKSIAASGVLAVGMLAAAPSFASHFTPDGTFTAAGSTSLSALGGAIRIPCHSVFTIQVTGGVGVVTSAVFSPDPANGNNANCNNLQATNYNWALNITSATAGIAQGVKVVGINGNPVTCGAGPVPLTLNNGVATFNGQLNPGACAVASGALPVTNNGGGATLSIVYP